MRLLRLVIAAALLVPLATITGGTSAAQEAQQETTDGVIKISGRGWGHGRGLGQYGALGYAIDHSWSSGQILQHYYGNTTAGSVNAQQVIRVALLAHDSRPLVLHATNDGMAIEGIGPAPGNALKIERVQPGKFQISDGQNCSGPWTPRPNLVSATSVTVFPPAIPPQSRDDMLQACEFDTAGLKRTRWYRGKISAVDTSTDTGQRAVNHVVLDEYLRGVVPREMPASWADLGGGKGMHALRAQAVSARSYADAEARWSYAETCDTISCQVYGGHAVQEIFAPFTTLEDSRSNQAIADTSGQVRLLNGAVTRSEFSSSTGGWTAGGTFPAVPDEGDDISSNPNHTWTTEVKFSKLEQSSAGQGKGSFRDLEVVARNGLGQDGGRVTKIVLHFSGGDVTLTGLQFRSAAGIKSDWFRIESISQPTVEPRAIDDSCPDGQVPPSGFTDIADNPHGHAIDCVAWWEIASGTSSTTYAPSLSVSRAQMATFIARTIEKSGGTLPETTTNHFSDDEGNPHEPNINRLAEAGLVAGVGDGRYGPNLSVSRAQMATFLVSAFEYRTGDKLTATGDYFTDDEGNAHEPNINKAAGAGFAGGTAAATYSPSAPVRRDQMASFLARVLDLLVEGGDASVPTAL